MEKNIFFSEVGCAHQEEWAHCKLCPSKIPHREPPYPFKSQRTRFINFPLFANTELVKKIPSLSGIVLDLTVEHVDLSICFKDFDGF